MKRYLKNPYYWYTAILGILCLTPLLAPILMKLGESIPALIAPAKLIYLFYSFTCHQFASRSIHLFDYQLAWCARDTGIWLAIFVGAVLVKGLRLKGISWYWLIPLVIPIALDGGIQTITTALNIQPFGIVGSTVYISSNVVRFITGSLFGLGVSMWLSPLLADSFDEKYHALAVAGKLQDGWQQLKALAVTFATMFGFYVGMVFLWNATSEHNKPSDWLDSAVKTPESDFYARRQDGACPTVGEDLFNVDCLIGR